MFYCIGVCNIPPCDSRTPLEEHLCRTGPDDECFSLSVVGTDDEICVSECPEGTEEEHTPQGVSTGVKLNFYV
jgi:hypothetical protein